MIVVALCSFNSYSDNFKSFVSNIFFSSQFTQAKFFGVVSLKVYR